MLARARLVASVVVAWISVAGSGCTSGESQREPPPAPLSEILVPSGYSASQPSPLVVYLHGYTSDANLDVIGITKTWLQLQDAANATTVLVSLPLGRRDARGVPFWNGAGCCDVDGSNPDDVASLRAVVADVRARYRVDPRRIYFMGHSNGAYMAHRMGCEAADVVAGIAAIAGSVWADPSRCVPSAPVAVLQVHPDQDVTYSGGSFYLSGKLFTPPSAEASVGTWAALDGCSAALVDTGLRLDLDGAVAGSETEVASHACAQGAAALWSMRGSGHGPTFLAPAATITMVEWLLAHPKPP